MLAHQLVRAPTIFLEDFMSEREIPLVRAAQALRLSYHACLDAVLRGELRGRQDERGRWVCERSDVERLATRGGRARTAAGTTTEGGAAD